MARHEFRALDRIRVSVHGENAYRMFAPAAAQGIRLRQISSNPEGYSATLLGRDWPRLENLAGKSFAWNKRQAFEQAKSYIRTKYPEPFYWAGFVMLD